MKARRWPALPWILATCLQAGTWIEIVTPRFHVLTDAGEPAARRMVIDLNQFDDAVAHSVIGSSRAATGPQRIYLFQNEREFAEFRNSATVAGLTLTPASQAAPIILTFGGSNLRSVAIHEYVHALVRRGDWKLPRWFEEGLAELNGHSTRDGTDTLSLGQPVPEYLDILTKQRFTASTYASPGSQPTLFYAASWAMVHMLLMEPGLRALTERLLSEGDDWSLALPALVKDLESYRQRQAWKQSSVYAPAPAKFEGTTKAIPPIDAEFMLADLLLDVGHPVDARKRYKKIANTHPNEASGAEATGLLALTEGRPDLARRNLQHAADLGSTRARVWFELATLERQARSPWPQVKPLLERALSLDPSDYQSAFLLGVHESDEGHNQQAVEYLAMAVTAAPGRPEVWHTYAFALSQLGQVNEARVAAKRALRVASSSDSTLAWEKAAQDLLHSLDTASPVTSSGTKRTPPVVITSPAWTGPQPDATAEGLFVDFNCQADPPYLKLELEDGKTLDLVVRDPRQVSILTSQSGGLTTTLKCGPQDGSPITVGYRRSDSTLLLVKFLQVHDSKRF